MKDISFDTALTVLGCLAGMFVLAIMYAFMKIKDENKDLQNRKK